jgi:hypothetical protein
MGLTLGRTGKSNLLNLVLLQCFGSQTSHESHVDLCLSNLPYLIMITYQLPPLGF